MLQRCKDLLHDFEYTTLLLALSTTAARKETKQKNWPAIGKRWGRPDLEHSHTLH